MRPEGSGVARASPGQVVVRRPNVFVEYWGNAPATAEALLDGWFLPATSAPATRMAISSS